MRQKIIPVSLVMAISFLFLFSCAYSYYNSLIEADFLTCGLKFEAADIDGLLFDKQNIVGGMPSPVSVSMFMGVELFGSPLDIFAPLSLQGITYSILRC